MNFNNFGETSWKVMIFIGKHAGSNNKIDKIYQEIPAFSIFIKLIFLTLMFKLLFHIVVRTL